MSHKVREDPRITRTRQLIVQAFQELLGEKHFESLTIQEIADRATVNRGTFYAHFEDKYVLLDFAFNEAFKSELCTKLSPTSEFSSKNLQLLIQTVCEFLEKSSVHCVRSGTTQVEAGIGRQLQKQVYEFLLAWLKKAELDQPTAELQATITSWAIYGAAKRWNEGKRNQLVQDFVRQAFPIIAASLDVPVDSARNNKAVTMAI